MLPEKARRLPIISSQPKIIANIIERFNIPLGSIGISPKYERILGVK